MVDQVKIFAQYRPDHDGSAQDDLLMLEIVVAGFPNELSQVPTDNYLLRQRICRMESIADLDRNQGLKYY